MRKLVLVAVLIAGSAGAQFDPGTYQSHNFLFDGLAQSNMANVHDQMMLDRAEVDGRSESGKPTRLSVVPDAAALEFTPSRKLRQANYASFVARSRRADPAGADGLAETLSSDPIAMMEPQLAKVGLRVDNIADAYAVYWVEAWQAVHGVTGASSRQTATAVSRQAANAIGATSEFARATSAQKQEFAEALLVQALLIGAAKDQAGGDRAKLRQVSAAVEKGARATGLDLRAMTLTEEGFGPARKTGAADPAPGVKPKALAATEDAGSRPGYSFLAAAAGGAGLGAAFLIGKAMGRKG